MRCGVFGPCSSGHRGEYLTQIRQELCLIFAMALVNLSVEEYVQTRITETWCCDNKFWILERLDSVTLIRPSQDKPRDRRFVDVRSAYWVDPRDGASYGWFVPRFISGPRVTTFGPHVSDSKRRSAMTELGQTLGVSEISKTLQVPRQPSITGSITRIYPVR